MFCFFFGSPLVNLGCEKFPQGLIGVPALAHAEYLVKVHTTMVLSCTHKYRVRSTPYYE